MATRLAGIAVYRSILFRTRFIGLDYVTCNHKRWSSFRKPTTGSFISPGFKSKEKSDENKKIGKYKRLPFIAGAAGVAIGGGVATVIAAPIVLSAVGFGAAGVAAGSIAAGVQSSIGSVAAGSVFATLQSAGAAGIGAKALSMIGLGASASSLGLYKSVKREDTDKKEEQREDECNDKNSVKQRDTPTDCQS